ncbi:hypothetical protein ACFWFF_09980 [Streptomyces sp. NPDC060223]|uniref:hypothetical protein n=1 Tax=unclassified Streptomyces TaxID=2593676 RepID=UPI0036349BEC
MGVRLRRGGSRRTAPADFLTRVEGKAEELVRAAEAVHIHGRAHQGIDPKGGNIIVPGGMFTYQVIVRSERVYVVQITYLGF